jgi:hypothetical protein
MLLHVDEPVCINQIIILESFCVAYILHEKRGCKLNLQTVEIKISRAVKF